MEDYSDSFAWLFAYGPPKNKKAEEKKQKLEKLQQGKPKPEKPNNKPNQKPGGNKPGDNKPKPDKPGENRASQQDLNDVIHVTDVQLNIEANTGKHFTDKYECTQSDVDPVLVVRRGKYFRLSVTFDRQYNIENDDLKFVFKTGDEKFKRSDATFGSFMMDESSKKSKKVHKEWEAKLIKREGKTLHIKVHTPCDCAIGDFSFNVITHTKVKDKKVKKLKYEHPDDILVLFNPWNKNDETYYPVVEELDEYVLNDHGAVYRGSAMWQQGKDWNFGQFEAGVVDAALLLLQKCFRKKNLHKLGDPVTVARKIAAVVNCNDADSGVLWGNWSGEYEGEGCCSPLDWYGSPRILRQYIEDDHPVRYGQCWVFSGVTTTVCRALGLPARSVTNFGSAHDTDQSCTIDKYHSRNDQGELEEDDYSDSIWNYHVWNEVWMKRNDIPWKEEERVKFDGWQAIDATPQEESGGMMTCGPCPVYAVKHGMVNVPFDCAFIFSEVNADVVHWEITPEGQQVFNIETDMVGQGISTKKADGKPFNKDAWFDRSRVDITGNYKYPEGSEKNREAVMRAALGTKKSKGAYEKSAENNDIKFKLVHDSDMYLGQKIKFTLTARNESEYLRDIGVVTFRFLTQNYNGHAAGPPFKKIKMDADKELTPKKDYPFEAVLEPKDYLPHIDDGRNICIQVYAMVKATNTSPLQNFSKVICVELAAPIVEVSMPAAAKKGAEFTATVTFTNPFTYPLTNCKAGFEGRGFDNVTGEKKPDVPGNGKYEGKLTLKAKKKGLFTLTFKFTSKQLKHLSTSGIIKIE